MIRVEGIEFCATSSSCLTKSVFEKRLGNRIEALRLEYGYDMLLSIASKAWGKAHGYDCISGQGRPSVGNVILWAYCSSHSIVEPSRQHERT